jgi:hypothetical protein
MTETLMNALLAEYEGQQFDKSHPFAFRLDGQRKADAQRKIHQIEQLFRSYGYRVLLNNWHAYSVFDRDLAVMLDIPQDIWPEIARDKKIP